MEKKVKRKQIWEKFTGIPNLIYYFKKLCIFKMRQGENSEELHRKSCWITVAAKIYYAVSAHNTGVTVIN